MNVNIRLSPRNSKSDSSLLKMLPQMPGARIRKTLKRGRISRLKGNKVEILVWLEYLLAMQKIAAAAEEKAKEDRISTIYSEHIKSAAKKVLKSCRG